MDEALDLALYLPLSFKTKSEEQYIQFLWEAFVSNYESEKYQFASFAYHMLAMSFVYFNIWHIMKTNPDDFAKGLIGFSKDIEKSLLKANSSFALSIFSESSILRFFRLIECDNTKIGTYAKLVSDRNESAHANGNIYYNDQRSIDIKVAEVLRVVREIQTHSQPVVERCYHAFLLSSHDSEEREYPGEEDQIREVLIHENYFSQRDIEVCCAYKLTSLHSHDAYEVIDGLHETLRATYVIS